VLATLEREITDPCNLQLFADKNNRKRFLADYKGKFSADGDALTGWVIPGGGGYEATVTQVK
jgi:hypothetical protein